MTVFSKDYQAKNRTLNQLNNMPAQSKQRIIQFKLMLTPSEKQKWTKLAQLTGLNISELVRRRMAGCRLQAIPKANWQFHWQLGKIGNNINQIAKAQNTAIAQGLITPPIDPIPFEELQKQIDKLRLQLLLGTDDNLTEENEIEVENDWEN
jgi:hypothetical protein